MLYDSLAAQMLGYLRGRGARDPEGLLGDCFLQIAANLHRFEGEESGFRSWAFTMAHNRLTDERRRYARRPGETPLPESEVGLPHAPGGTEDQVVAAMDGSAVEMLSELTDDQRAVILLRILGGFSTAETAQMLDKSEGAVRVLQHRALQSLKESVDTDA